MDRWALTDSTAIHPQPISNIIYSLHSAALLDNTHVLWFNTVSNHQGDPAGMKLWMNIKMNILV